MTTSRRRDARRHPDPSDHELAIGGYVYRIEPGCPGLAIQRQCRRGATLLHQEVLVADLAEFDRWCDRQPTRFEDPRLHEQLRRAGHELLHRPE